MESTGSFTAPLGSVGRDTPLQGKRALVTGAASGIGRAVAEHLSRLGAQVVFSDIDSAALATSTAALNGASVIAADLAVPAEVERLAREAGAVDIRSTTPVCSTSTRSKASRSRSGTGCLR